MSLSTMIDAIGGAERPDEASAIQSVQIDVLPNEEKGGRGEGRGKKRKESEKAQAEHSLTSASHRDMHPYRTVSPA